MLAALAPSRKMANGLGGFIDHHRNDDDNADEIRELADDCAFRLEWVMRVGLRKEVPSRAEIYSEQKREDTPVWIYTLDGARHMIHASPFTTVKEARVGILDVMELEFSGPFALYQLAHDGEEIILDHETRILDVVGSWDRIKRERKIKDEHFFRIVFKAEIVLKTSKQVLVDDPEAVRLLYVQAFNDVVTEKYPCNKKDLCRLAALHLQCEYGNYNADVMNDQWFA